MSTTMTVRLESELERRLDRLADATKRPKSFLSSQEIRSAIAEADREDFASEEEVKEVLGKWGVDAGQVAGQ